MKIYISADIEGVTGIAHWDEADPNKPDYEYFRQQMTAEVAAACQACLEAGASQVWVKDAHATARNLIPSKLPREVRLVRGWSGHPFMMAQELDESFDAMMMIGYHSRAGSDANPLAHTISSSRVGHVEINGQSISECLMHAYAGAWAGVPLVFLSGDEGLCQEMQALNPHMVTNAVMRGVGHSTVSIHPELALENIRQGVRQALQGDLARCRLPLPEHFSVEVAYKVHWQAYRASFFPGASLKEPGVVRFEVDDYFEVMRFFLFTL